MFSINYYSAFRCIIQKEVAFKGTYSQKNHKKIVENDSYFKTSNNVIPNEILLKNVICTGINAES